MEHYPLVVIAQLFQCFLLSPLVASADHRLKCNWAQGFTDFPALLANEALQEQIMMTASEWEGNFAAGGFGVNKEFAITDSITYLNINTGYARKKEFPSKMIAKEESLHLAILAQALNGSKYARKFLEISMREHWSGLAEDFIIDQLIRKMNAYEKFESNLPGRGGLMAAEMYLTENQIHPGLPTPLLYSADQGFLGWGLIAAGEALRAAASGNASIVDMAMRYRFYAETIANHLMTAFYDPTGKQLFRTSIFKNQFAEFNESNIIKGAQCVSDCYIGNYDEDLVAQFAYLVADWSHFGGEYARETFLVSRRQFLKSKRYNTMNGAVTVQQGNFFASWEKIPHLFLPYFDVPITERLFLNGERARTYFSASSSYPGLFSSVDTISFTDNFTEYYLWEYYKALGIEQLAAAHIATYDIVTPYAAFPLLLHKKTRAYGLAWYLAMLQGAKMQGPLGASDSYRKGNLIPSKLSWQKVTPIIAFGGGVASLIRSYLMETKKYDDFITTVDSEYAYVFFSLQGENVPFYLPTVTVNANGTRFSACSNIDYANKLPKPSSSSSSKTTMIVCIVVSIVVLVLCGIGLLTLYYFCVIRTASTSQSPQIFISSQNDDALTCSSWATNRITDYEEIRLPQMNRPANRPVNRPVNRPANRPVNHPGRY